MTGFVTQPGLPELPDFHGQQACLNLDPGLFFADSPGVEAARARDLASVCNECPVVAQCLEYALANAVEGVWAGTTTAQRRRLRKRARVNSQQQRAQQHRATVRDLARKGHTSAQIIATTGIHEQTVWRTLRAMASEGATEQQVA